MYAILTADRHKKHLFRITEQHFGTVRYFIIRCGRKIDLNKIQRKLKKKVKAIFIPEYLQHYVIEFESIPTLFSQGFIDAIFKNSATDIIKNAHDSIYICDRDCNMPSLAELAVRHCDDVRIVGESDKWTDFCEHIYNKYGTLPQICENTGTGTVINCDERSITVDSSTAKLDRKYLNRSLPQISVPDGIDLVDFTAFLALHREFEHLYNQSL